MEKDHGLYADVRQQQTDHILLQGSEENDTDCGKLIERSGVVKVTAFCSKTSITAASSADTFRTAASFADAPNTAASCADTSETVDSSPTQVSVKGPAVVWNTQPTQVAPLEHADTLMQNMSSLQSGPSSGQHSVPVGTSGIGTQVNTSKSTLCHLPGGTSGAMLPSPLFETDIAGQVDHVNETCPSQSNTSLHFSDKTVSYGLGMDSAYSSSMNTGDICHSHSMFTTVAEIHSEMTLKSSGDSVMENTNSLESDIKFVPELCKRMVPNRTDSCGASKELSPGLSVRIESQRIEESANSCHVKMKDMYSDIAKDSVIPCIDKSLEDNSKVSHDKENLLKKCSVVLIRQQHAVSETSSRSSKTKSLQCLPTTKSSKHIPVKPHASSVLKRNRPAKKKQLKKRLAKDLPVRDCFVLLTCEHPFMKQKSKNRKSFTKNCHKDRMHRSRMSSQENTKPYSKKFSERRLSKQKTSLNIQSGRQSCKKTDNMPLRECFVILNHQDLLEQRESFTAKNVKQNSIQCHYQVPQRYRSSQGRNSGLKLSHTAAGLKSAAKQQLTECFVVLKRERLEMATDCRSPFRSIPTSQTHHTYSSDQRKERNWSTAKMSADSQGVKDCLVVLKREPDVLTKQHTILSKNLLCSSSISQSASVPIEKRSLTSKPFAEISTENNPLGSKDVSKESVESKSKRKSLPKISFEGKPVCSCFVRLTREKLETKISPLKSRLLETGVVVPAAPEKTVSIPEWPIQAHERPTHQQQQKSSQLKQIHAHDSFTAPIPHCSVVLFRLPASNSENRHIILEQRQLSRCQRQGKCSRSLHLETGHIPLRDCSVDLFKLDQLEVAKHCTGSTKLPSVARSCKILKSYPFQTPSEPLNEDNDLCLYRKEPAQNKPRSPPPKKDSNLKNGLPLKECCVTLTHLSTSAPKKLRQPAKKKVCDPTTSSKKRAIPSQGVAEEEVSVSEVKHLPVLKPRRSSLEESKTPDRKMTVEHTNVPLKECTIVLSRHQDCADGRVNRFIETPIVQQSVGSRKERSARTAPSVEQHVPGRRRRATKNTDSDKKDKPNQNAHTMEQSLPAKRGKPTKSCTHQFAADREERSTKTIPSEDKSLTWKNIRPIKEAPFIRESEAGNGNIPASVEPSLHGQIKRLTKTIPSIEESETDRKKRSAQGISSADQSLRRKRGRLVRKTPEIPLVGLGGDLPPTKRARQSEDEPHEHVVQDVNDLMFPAGIWVKPFLEKRDQSQGIEAVLGESCLSELHGSGVAIDTKTQDMVPGTARPLQSDSSNQVSSRKRGCLSKLNEEQTPKCKNQEKEEEADPVMENSDVESDGVMLIGEDFFVIREQSDCEDDEEELSKESEGELDKKALRKEETNGQKMSGEVVGDDCSVTVSLDETDGHMYMQMVL